MNKRIQELEKQSYTEVMHEMGGTYMAFDKEKFAELIIRECATELLKWKDEPFPFDEDLAVRLIKDHFGVKE
jgi:hypothetical protein